MISRMVDDVKSFMLMLFSAQTFDDYSLVEAEVVMGCKYRINGRRSLEFYDTAEDEQLSEFCSWQEIKNVVFAMIKGKRLPVSMKLVLSPPQKLKESLAGDIGGMSFYLNVHYDNKGLMLVTGTSTEQFTLDRSAELKWDEYIKNINFISTH